MTALNFHLTADMVCLAMDTIGVSPENKMPVMYTTKIFPLPHLDGVMCGTGLFKLILDWFVEIESSLVVRDISHLCSLTPQLLQKCAKKYPAELINTTTIYQIGYSENEKKFKGYIFRSSKQFRLEELSYCLYTKPGYKYDPSKPLKLPEDFIKVIDQQRQNDRSLPIEQQVGIGGDIHVFIMVPRQQTVFRLHRFPDYLSQYKEMCKNL